MKTIEENKKLREMKDAELQKELEEMTRKSALLSLSVKAGKAKDFSAVSKIKKTVARINTIIREKQAE